MNFLRLSEAYFNGSVEDRLRSSIEYKSLSGTPIAPGVTSQQMTFTAKGDGTVEFFRRGSFMERGSAFPGLWRAQCEKADLEKVWDKLGELGPDSFPARVADPGDTISGLAAYFPDQIESLSWGPPDHDVEAPGDDFLVALAPLMNLAAEGETIWAVEMSFNEASPTDTGISVKLTFRNPGKRPIGIVSSEPSLSGGFTLRYAIDRETRPGVTPLPVEWSIVKMDIPDRISETIWNLIPEAPVTVSLLSEFKIEVGKRYIAKIQYEQTRHLDSFAGIPILTGACFTEVFEFQT